MSLRVLLAPDSFKESMTAAEAAEVMRQGVLDVRPDAQISERPVSDGGEGFLDVVADDHTTIETTLARNALGEEVEVQWARSGVQAFIEVARVIGLEAIAAGDRTIMASDTRGVGQVISAAMDADCLQIVIGLGGSATCDGGAGMLAQLGVRFLDAAGLVLEPTPAGLMGLSQVDREHLDPRLANVQLIVASDVTNPLTGPAGAAATFGPQKGATDEQVVQLDKLLTNLAFLFEGEAEEANSRVPGAGAAGGLGWALLMLGAQIRPGVQVVAERTGLAESVAQADLVLTGEGSMDGQTLGGKLVSGVAALAASHQVPCHVLAGRVGEIDPDAMSAAGITSATQITPEGTPLAEALRQGPANLRRATAELLRRVG